MKKVEWQDQSEEEEKNKSKKMLSDEESGMARSKRRWKDKQVEESGMGRAKLSDYVLSDHMSHLPSSSIAIK